jgi:hypothetical protein
VNPSTLRDLRLETYFILFQLYLPLPTLHPERKSGFITGWLWNPTFGNMFIRFFEGFILIASDMKK